jgi:hypothetical protein
MKFSEQYIKNYLGNVKYTVDDNGEVLIKTGIFEHPNLTYHDTAPKTKLFVPKIEDEMLPIPLVYAKMDPTI